jgi:hypothetical protein
LSTTLGLTVAVLIANIVFASAAFLATDCPPLGAMPNYAAAAEAEVRPYDIAEL